MPIILRNFFAALTTFWAEVIDADFWGEAKAARKAAHHVHQSS
jgi:hypothetical protein